MRCAWLNKILTKFGEWCSSVGTVPAIIRNPDNSLTQTNTVYTLDELIESLEGTGCVVEFYNGDKVERSTEDELDVL